VGEKKKGLRLDRWLACKGDAKLRPDAWPTRATRPCRQLLAQLPTTLEQFRPEQSVRHLNGYWRKNFYASISISIEHFLQCDEQKTCAVRWYLLTEWNPQNLRHNIICATERFTPYDTCTMITATRYITLYVQNLKKKKINSRVEITNKARTLIWQTTCNELCIHFIHQPYLNVLLLTYLHVYLVCIFNVEWLYF